MTGKVGRAVDGFRRGATLTVEARPRRQVFVGGLVTHLRHQIVAVAFGDELRDIGIRITEIAEMPGADRAGGDAGGHAFILRQRFIVDAVDAERALLHDADVFVVFARPIGAGPGTELAADAHILVHKDDAVGRALERRASWADRDAIGFRTMETGFREMHRAAGGTFAGFEGMNAVEPDAARFFAEGVEVGERRHMATGIPFLAIDGAGMTADADVEIDDEAEAARCRFCWQRGHDFSSAP